MCLNIFFTIWCDRRPTDLVGRWGRSNWCVYQQRQIVGSDTSEAERKKSKIHIVRDRRRHQRVAYHSPTQWSRNENLKLSAAHHWRWFWYTSHQRVIRFTRNRNSRTQLTINSLQTIKSIAHMLCGTGPLSVVGRPLHSL